MKEKNKQKKECKYIIQIISAVAFIGFLLTYWIITTEISFIDIFISIVSFAGTLGSIITLLVRYNKYVKKIWNLYLMRKTRITMQIYVKIMDIFDENLYDFRENISFKDTKDIKCKKSIDYEDHYEVELVNDNGINYTFNLEFSSETVIISNGTSNGKLRELSHFVDEMEIFIDYFRSQLQFDSLSDNIKYIATLGFERNKNPYFKYYFDNASVKDERIKAASIELNDDINIYSNSVNVVDSTIISLESKINNTLLKLN